MTSIPALIERAARWYGDRVAVLDGERQLSFRELDRRSNQLANALVGLSPDRGARVALLMRNRQEFVEADFAIAKAAKVRVPINPRLVERERAYVLANSGAETLIFDAEHSEFVDKVRADVPELKHVVCVDPAVDGIAGADGYEDLVARADARAPGLAHSPGDDNFILYTSGTTGRPKGATATNGSRLAATVHMLAEEIDAGPGDAMAHVGAMAHGSGSKVLAYYLRGARNIVVPKFDPEAFLDLIEHKGITSTFLVPTMVAMLIEAAGGPGRASALRSVSYGGAPITPARLEEAMETFGNVFVQVYGSCEAPHPVMVLPRSAHVVDAEHRYRLGSVGREVAGVDIRLTDPEGLPVALGEPGEMAIRGPNVMRGYWNNPEATDAALVGGWYRSGDIARQDDDGYFYIVDRARDMIISGGLNVYPAEVEAVIGDHPSVAEVAVVGVPDEKWGEAVTAFVVVRGGHALDEQVVLEHCRLTLAAYKKPQSVTFLSELPKGSTGKILKRELVSTEWAGRERRVN